jgi:hypothetical protein
LIGDSWKNSTAQIQNFQKEKKESKPNYSNTVLISMDKFIKVEKRKNETTEEKDSKVQKSEAK